MTALGDGVAPTVDAWLAGRSGLAKVTAFDATPFGDPDAALLGPVPAGAPDDARGGHVPEAHARILKRCARAAHDAARASGLPRERVGLHVALGSSDADPALLSAAVVASRDAEGRFDLARYFSDGWRHIHPLWPLSLLNNVAAGEASKDLDVRGDNGVVSGDQDAGVLAFVEALSALADGSATATVVAGVADPVSPASLLRESLGTGPRGPLGEGGAALFLEGEASARARGVALLAHVSGAAAGFGAVEGAEGTNAPALLRAAREALAEAGLSTADVGLVVADGASVGEAETRRSLFGRGERPAVAVPALALGRLGAGFAAVAAALAADLLARGIAPSATGGRPHDLRGARAALVLASGHSGGVGALVVEAAR